MGKKEERPPKDGVCCGCGYSAPEETPCPKREYGTHCVHWWDGPTPDEVEEVQT